MEVKGHVQACEDFFEIVSVYETRGRGLVRILAPGPAAKVTGQENSKRTTRFRGYRFPFLLLPQMYLADGILGDS